MMFTDSLPLFKRFLRPAALNPVAITMLLRMACAFLDHRGHMSARAGADALLCDPCHRALLCRWLARWPKRWQALRALNALLFRHAASHGRWVFCVDSTFVGHQGKPANAYSHANTKTRKKKSLRNQLKYHKRSCHCFVMGLLISPEGIRIPYCLCFYTREYCKLIKLPYCTQAQLAADLIKQLEVPAGIELVVLGDTAFDSKDVHQACSQRGFSYVVPINPERVLAGADPRPKVRSLIKDFTEEDYAEIRLTPQKDARRRLSAGRAQLKKRRRYFINSGEYRVHSVGNVRLVFSKTSRQQQGQKSPAVKILISNRTNSSGRELVELYALRWQVENCQPQYPSSARWGVTARIDYH